MESTTSQAYFCELQSSISCLQVSIWGSRPLDPKDYLGTESFPELIV